MNIATAYLGVDVYPGVLGVPVCEGSPQASLFTDPDMVLILDGHSEHVAHACKKMGLLGEKISDL